MLIVLKPSCVLCEINRIIHYYECGIVKFHRGDKIHGLGRGFTESKIVNLCLNVEFYYIPHEFIMNDYFSCIILH